MSSPDALEQRGITSPRNLRRIGTLGAIGVAGISAVAFGVSAVITREKQDEQARVKSAQITGIGDGDHRLTQLRQDTEVALYAAGGTGIAIGMSLGVVYILNRRREESE